MESCNYFSEPRGLLFSDEIDVTADGLPRTRKFCGGWGLKPSLDYEIGVLVPEKQEFQNSDTVDLSSVNIIEKVIPRNSSLGHLSGEVRTGSDSSEIITSPPCMGALSSELLNEESRPRVSNSVMEFTQHVPLIDLKLGRLADQREDSTKKDSREERTLSLAATPLPAKRTRATSLCTQTPFCQVYGCNKDLSTSKDYHKRHKVCDLHSKTAKVIVNGIEQRFCQQCSRFHLLVEFDDGKRSCRKRLAGHNERRRKPQFDIQASKVQRFFQPYRETSVFGTSLSQSQSLVFSGILPAGVRCHNKYGLGNHCKHIKLKQEHDESSQSVVPFRNGQSLLKPVPYLHGVGRQHPSEMLPSLEEYYAIVNAAPNIQGLSGGSNSSCALSLLSAQSQSLSSHLEGTSAGSPVIIQSDHVYKMGQNSDMPFELRSSENPSRRRTFLSGINLAESDHIVSSKLPDTNVAVDFEVDCHGVFKGSDFADGEYCLSPEHGLTVDLFQLSSHLQRVERQRNAMQVIQENDINYCFPAT
ncbi:SBP domain [Dillenia turbinata]|uniref:SBP domain n=1 Tax=Dillenia turbinata TaxID=194707 RepID=A0AAN8V6Y1_9MAGN